MPNESKTTKNVQGRVKNATYDFLEQYANDKDRSIGYFVAKAVEEYVEKLRKEEGAR